jgi:6-phosphofructokinase 1
MDRVLASQMGIAAVQSLLEGESNIAIGIQCGKITKTPLHEATKYRQNISQPLLQMLEILTGMKGI